MCECMCVWLHVCIHVYMCVSDSACGRSGDSPAFVVGGRVGGIRAMPRIKRPMPAVAEEVADEPRPARACVRLALAFAVALAVAVALGQSSRLRRCITIYCFVFFCFCLKAFVLLPPAPFLGSRNTGGW